MSRTIVVVPCYNEAKRLDVRAFEEFGRHSDSVSLLFVNDGSRDTTGQIIERLHASFPRRLNCWHLQSNRGKAEAVRQGLLEALSARPEQVGFWDADLATPLADIETFSRVLSERADIEVVVGTRMPLLGHKIERQPLRYWLGRLFARTASLALGIRIFDTQCGAKLFRVTPQLQQILRDPFQARWIFDVELLARLKLVLDADCSARLDEKVYEYPLGQWRDVAGTTLKRSDFVKAVAELAKIYWTYCRPGAPGLEPAPILAVPQAPASSRPDQQQAA